jgi:hypothetical protein
VMETYTVVTRRRRSKFIGVPLLLPYGSRITSP